MKLLVICFSFILICSSSFASHGKKEEKSSDSKKKEEKKKNEKKGKEEKGKEEKKHGDKKEEGKKDEKKKDEHKKDEHKKEEAKKEEPKKPLPPPDPKIVRDYKEQEVLVKTLQKYIKTDEKEIEKCRKGKDLQSEEKKACPKNVDSYRIRIEKNKLKLSEAELKLRTMEKAAKKRMPPPKPAGEHH